MTDRLPIPGEEGWQALCSDDNWHDCEIKDGPFYNRQEFKHATGYSLRVVEHRFHEAVFFIEGELGLGGAHLSDLRRKPEQRDNKAADEDFQEDLNRWLTKEVPANV